MELLKHFHQLSLYPTNAKELKGLILQLAVQGKLTKDWRSRNSIVDAASVLLERIQEHKEALISEKKIKKIKDNGLITAEEEDFELPLNWEWSRLGWISKQITDGTHHTPKYIDSGVKFLSVKDISSGKINLENTKFISQEEHNELIKRCNPELNDIMFCRIGTLGVPVIVNIDEPFSIFVSVGLIKFFTEEVDPKYLRNALDSPLMWDQYMTVKAGGSHTNKLNLRDIPNLRIPLPPLEEQKAIVEIVEQLFEEVEQLEQLTEDRVQLKLDYGVSALHQLTNGDTTKEWQNLQPHFHTFFNEEENIKKLRETILQLAVQGKLTSKWRAAHTAIEPASELLERIKAEKAQLIKEKNPSTELRARIKKEKPLPPIAEDEIPYELPEGWFWCRFQEAFDIRDGTHDSPKDSLDKKTYPLVTSKNFKNGEIDFDSARRISEEDYLKVIQRSQVHTGDILFSMIGGNIGNQVEVGKFTEYAIKNVALFKHYKFGIPAPGFLKVYSQHIALSLQSEAAGGAQPFVSLKFFRNLVLGLPPLEEQKAIVSKVNALMALCDELEAQVQESKTQAEQLMQSVLREVFETGKEVST